MTRTLKTILILSLLLVPLPTMASDVLLRKEVTIEHSVIRLSDVFDGVDVMMDKEIAIAPAPGKSVTYDANVLTRLAARYSLAWKASSVADKTVLKRGASYITPDMIRALILRKIKLTERYGESIEIKFDNRVTGLTLPASEDVAFDIDAFDYNQETRRFRGKVMARNVGISKGQFIVGHVVVRRRIPVLSRRLAAGTIISQSDIRWIDVDDLRVNGDVLTEASQIVGQELRREQGEGARFRSRDISVPRMVKRGQLVTLKVQTAFMQIATQGRALQDGAMGESVRVKNTRSKQIIEGTVVSAGVIRVGALRQMASVE